MTDPENKMRIHEETATGVINKVKIGITLRTQVRGIFLVFFFFFSSRRTTRLSVVTADKGWTVATRLHLAQKSGKMSDNFHTFGLYTYTSLQSNNSKDLMLPDIAGSSLQSVVEEIRNYKSIEFEHMLNTLNLCQLSTLVQCI